MWWIVFLLTKQHRNFHPGTTRSPRRANQKGVDPIVILLQVLLLVHVLIPQGHVQILVTISTSDSIVLWCVMVEKLVGRIW